MAGLRAHLRWIFTAKTVHMMLWIGFGGLTYAIGNLLFAGALNAAAFGRLALFQAFVGLGAGLAPLGLDGLVIRRELRSGAAPVPAATLTGGLVGLIIALIAFLAFEFDSSAAALILAATALTGAARVCAAEQQAAMRLGLSQFLTQTPFLCFGLGAPVLLFVGVDSWLPPAILLVVGYLLSAALGIRLSLSRAPGALRASGPGRADPALWRNALSLVGIMASVLLLHHLERLVVGATLGLEDLATYAVVATVVASPFRVLHGGIGFALMPRLKAERHAGGRRRLVRDELALASVLALGGGAILTALTIPVIRSLYGSKYTVTVALVLAIVSVGIVRALYSVAANTVSALGNARQLRVFNGWGWIAAMAAILLGATFSVYGLVGVVVGVGAGWLLRLVVAWVLARSVLRETGWNHG